MDTYETIAEALRFIEEKRQEPLTVRDIARRVYCSASHLQRLFRLVTGTPLMEYARGRKLADSLRAVREGDMRILDIAAEYGFAHEQSFIRAFTKEFGVTPGRAREDRGILPIRPRIAPEELRDIGQGVLYGPQIVEAPAFCVVGREHMLEEFIPARDAKLIPAFGIDFMLMDAPRVPGALDAQVYHALCSRLPPDNKLCYMPCLRVAHLAKVPEGLSGLTVPAFQGTLFRYTGRHGFGDIDMLTAREIFAAREAFFAGQTRYVPGAPIFQIERVDTRLYDGEYCHFELIATVRDTYAHNDTISS